MDVCLFGLPFPLPFARIPRGSDISLVSNFSWSLSWIQSHFPFDPLFLDLSQKHTQKNLFFLIWEANSVTEWLLFPRQVGPLLFFWKRWASRWVSLQKWQSPAPQMQLTWGQGPWEAVWDSTRHAFMCLHTHLEHACKKQNSAVLPSLEETLAHCFYCCGYFQQCQLHVVTKSHSWVTRSLALGLLGFPAALKSVYAIPI